LYPKVRDRRSFVKKKKEEEKKKKREREKEKSMISMPRSSSLKEGRRYSRPPQQSSS
jgi:hypothetical protein